MLKVKVKIVTPNRGVASKANTTEAMVDKDSPGDRTREAGVVLVHPIGLDEVGVTTVTCHQVGRLWQTDPS